MELIQAINVDHWGQVLKDFIAEDGIYFFFPLLLVFFGFCGWLIHHFRKRDMPATGYPPGSVPRGAIIIHPSPVGVYYDPEATPMPTHELPRGLRRTRFPDDDPSGF